MKAIQSIFKEEFKKKKNIGNLISTNFKITMEETGKRKTSDLRSSLKFTKDVLEQKVKKLEERCENMETELREFYNNNQINP